MFKGNRQTLVETSVDSTTSFQRLIDNVEFVGKKRGSLSIADGGTKLVYTRLGALLIIR